jgi:uncharacterized lipoprotein YmbA
MKKLQVFILFVAAYVVLLAGCASPGPPNQEQLVDLDQQLEAERQQAAFRKSLPPVPSPGRDQ